MKKFMFLMVIALLPMVFASCGSDDDDKEKGKGIGGVWKET